MAGESAEKWFHALRLPGGEVTPGRFPPHRPPNYTLYGALAFLARLDLRRADCLDIGTMDGLVAFAMAEAGAARVRATDIAPRPTFERARAALAPRVEYETPVSISDMGAVVNPAWDLIACCGVLYHVFDPLTVLATLRRNLREGGLLLLETQYLPGESRAHLSFAPAERNAGALPPNTFFRPGCSALKGMLEISGFDVVATISVRARLTVLARAEKPANIAGSTPTIRRVLERYRGFVNYREAIDHAALDRGGEAAAIDWHGPRGDFHLNTATRRPLFSSEPTWNPRLGPRLAAHAADLRARAIAMAARRCRLPIWPDGPGFTHPRSD